MNKTIIAIPQVKLKGIIPVPLTEKERHEEIAKQVPDYIVCRRLASCYLFATEVYEVEYDRNIG